MDFFKKNNINYAAWTITLSDFPKNSTIEKQINFFLRFGILAPSTHNTQPWKFKIQKNVLFIYPDFSYVLPEADPTNSNMFISIGCCITNILCAAEYYHFSTDLNLQGSSKNNAVIRITFHHNTKSNNTIGFLCPYISQRYSNKLSYLPKTIDKVIIDKLQTIKTTHTLQALITTDKSDIHQLATLQEIAIKNLSFNKPFREEISNWLRPNSTTRMDGMPGFVGGLKPLQTIIGKKLIAILPAFMNILAKKDKEVIESSPSIGIIIGEQEDLLTWINIGRTYELLALYATSFGLSMAPMHALVEDKELSKKVKLLFRVEEKRFYILFRLGFTNNKIYHTPRRLLENFLL